MTQITAPWVIDEAIQTLISAVHANGFDIFFVGGCVRDALLDRHVTDIDMATNALPKDIQRIADGLKFRTIPTGIEHGTITVLAHDTALEITTFRKDVETDGRHATVQFSTSLDEDARRRDFTINALYADATGTVHDPVDGLKDLDLQQVRFIGNPNARIREDYLRILRFFRFFAHFGNPSTGIDPDGLAACAAHQDGLESLPAERIGAEMKKLLTATDPAPAIAAMTHSGILGRILPGSDDKALAPFVHLEDGRHTSWVPRAVALGGEAPTDRWRLSKEEARHYRTLIHHVATTEPAFELAYRLGKDIARSIIFLRAAIFEQAPTITLEAELDLGAHAKFPLRANDLMPEFQGKALGDALSNLEVEWIKSRFELSRDALLKLAHRK